MEKSNWETEAARIAERVADYDYRNQRYGNSYSTTADRQYAARIFAVCPTARAAFDKAYRAAFAERRGS